MKVVAYQNRYYVVDSKDSLVTLSDSLVTLDRIFNLYWVGCQRDNYTLEGYEAITIDTSSFKALKHAVAGYLLSNAIKADIPERYIRAYEANKHLYKRIV